VDPTPPTSGLTYVHAMHKAASMPSMGTQRNMEMTKAASMPSLRGCTVFLDGMELRLTEDFMEEHPAGREIILALSGRDCTREFEEAGHSTSAWNWARSFTVAGRQGKVEELGAAKPVGPDSKPLLASRASALLSAIWSELLGDDETVVPQVGKPPAILDDGLPLTLGLISVASAFAAWHLRGLAWN